MPSSASRLMISKCVSFAAGSGMTACTDRGKYIEQRAVSAYGRTTAGFTDSWTSFENAEGYNIRVGNVSICYPLKNRCRDRHSIIEVIEMYGSLVQLGTCGSLCHAKSPA